MVTKWADESVAQPGIVGSNLCLIPRLLDVQFYVLTMVENVFKYKKKTKRFKTNKSEHKSVHILLLVSTRLSTIIITIIQNRNIV